MTVHVITFIILVMHALIFIPLQFPCILLPKETFNQVHPLTHTSKGCQVPIYLQTFISLGSPVIQLYFCSNNFIRGCFCFVLFFYYSRSRSASLYHFLGSLPTLLFYTQEYQLIVYWLSLLTRMSGFESWDLSALCLVVGIQYTCVQWINCTSWNFWGKVIF